MKRKKILTQLAGSILSIVITLLICECLLSYFYPQPLGPIRSQFNKELGYIYIPNLKGKQSAPGYFEYHFEHSNIGFRKTASQPNQFTRKIILLGDSFTYGFGVNTENTFAYLLQDSLLNKHIEVINAGHGGRGTDYALKVLQTIGKDPGIEMVIYFPFHNDFSDNFREEFYELNNENLTTKELYQEKWSFVDNSHYSWLTEHSHVFSTFHKVAFLMNHKPKIISADAFEDNPKRQTAFLLTKIYLNKIHEWCLSQNKKFAVYQIPSKKEMVYQLESDSTSPFINFFRTQTAEVDIPYYEFSPDLKPDFEKYYLKEGHWNRLGHKIAGKRLIKDIIEENKYKLFSD